MTNADIGMSNDTTHGVRRAETLAIAALVLATLASLVGLLVPGLYRDTPEMVRQAAAADMVTLFLAVPVLGLGLWLARSGSAFARLIAIGALGYLAYSYAIYSFSVVINPMTPVHIAILGLATWAFVLDSFGVDDETLDRSTRIFVPRRTTAGFLFFVAVLFAMTWLGQIAGAITSGDLPAAISDLHLPTNAVFALDLAFALPLFALAGNWLLRHDRRGHAGAVAVLAFTVLMGSSVLAIFAVDGAAGMAVEVAPVVIFGLVTGVAAALLAGGLRSPRTQPTLRSATTPT